METKQICEEFVDRLIPLLDKIRIEEKNPDRVIKFEEGIFRVSHFPDGTKILLFPDTIEKEISKCCLFLLETTRIKVGKNARESYLYGSSYVEDEILKIIDRTIMQKLDRAKMLELTKTAFFEKNTYEFLFKVNGIGMRTKSYSFGQVWFQNRIDSLNWPHDQFELLKIYFAENPEKIMKVKVTYFPDDDLAYNVAYRSAMQHIDCLNYVVSGYAIFERGWISLEEDTKDRKKRIVFTKNSSLSAKIKHEGLQVLEELGVLEDIIEDDVGKRLNNILQKESRTEEEEKILNAISWFCKASESEEPNIGLIFLWGALESALGRQGSKDKAKKEYQEIYHTDGAETIEYFYEARNVVHGSDIRRGYLPRTHYKHTKEFVYHVIKRKLLEIGGQSR